MPRGRVSRLPSAPSFSLALVSSILIALAALVPNGADAKRSEAPAEATPAASVTAPAAESDAAKAARLAERAARRAERAASGTSTGATETAAAPAAATHAARQAEHATRKAERVAEREARKATKSGSAAPAAAKAGASAKPAASAKPQKSHAERASEAERTREQRRRERDAKGGRLRGEGHKEREAREAREIAEGRELERAAGGSGSSRLPAAAGGVGDVTGGQPTAQAPSTAAVASERAGRAARTHARQGTRHTRRTAGAGAAGVLGLTALGIAATPTGEDPATAAGASHPKHHAAGGHKGESTIVRTVTQIVGVIPTALWLLIGALALAAAAFAVISRMTARRAGRLERQRKELLADVGLLQAALLPELPERVGPVATSAAYRPASGPGAGGDFYDVFALPDGLVAVIVGDVSGHGRDALPHTTLLRYTLRTYMEAGLSPREALHAAAPSLERQLGGYFATVVLASYDPRARTLTYACAGHPHPILSGLDPDTGIIAGSAPPIGAGKPTGSRQTVVSIPGESTACFYTDGVIEARADGRLYGQRRLAAALGAVRNDHTPDDGSKAPSVPPTAVELLDRVAAQTDRRPDDMAACLLGLAGGREAPRILNEELVVDGRERDGKRARRFLAAAGLGEEDLKSAVDTARAIAAEHGSALLNVDLAGERPRVTVLQDNVAPLRARALARTQEVAL